MPRTGSSRQLRQVAEELLRRGLILRLSFIFALPLLISFGAVLSGLTAHADQVEAFRIVRDVHKQNAMNIRNRISEGSVVHEGETVVTEPSSLALFSLRDGSKIKLGPRSRISFAELISRSKVNSQNRILLDVGSALFDIEPDGGKKTRIETSVASIGIRGTKFYVGYQPGARRLWVAVFEGVVEVRSKFNSQVVELVRAGESLVVDDTKFSAASSYRFGREVNERMNSDDADFDVFAKASQWLTSFLPERKEYQPASERAGKSTGEVVKANNTNGNDSKPGIPTDTGGRAILIVLGIVATILLLVFLIRKL